MGPALQKKNCPIVAAWTPECSWRSAIAPAGWTSSGLRALHKRRMGRRARWHPSRPLGFSLQRRKKTFLTRHPCAGGHVNFSVSFHGEAPVVCVILAPEPCNYDHIMVKKLQERVAPFVLLCRIEKKKNMQDLPTNTYILELCVSSLHRGHAKCCKSLT